MVALDSDVLAAPRPTEAQKRALLDAAAEPVEHWSTTDDRYRGLPPHMQAWLDEARGESA